MKPPIITKKTDIRLNGPPFGTFTYFKYVEISIMLAYNQWFDPFDCGPFDRLRMTKKVLFWSFFC